jgi:two-component system, NtrC family, response regulator AlgB
MNAGSPAGAALNILIVDDEPNIRRLLSMSLEGEGHHVETTSNISDARDAALRRSFEVAFVDLRLGTTSGLDLIPGLLSDSPWMKIVVITGYAGVDSAVEAMRRGAFDYLPKPFTPAQIRIVLNRIASLRAIEIKGAELQDNVRTTGEVELTSESPAMQRALETARQVAQSNASVLLRGESGTGKTVLARWIHQLSARSSKPFTTVSSPALSPELLESELFGHVRGAFTGATRDSAGRIAASEGGTLFLDEIGDLPLALQPKLLRFLQEHEYERVGDSKTRRADVRVIAATHVDLEAATQAGQFREDLFYRLNVIQIDLPPLRERQADIISIAQRLLVSVGGTRFTGFTDDAIELIRRYSWPGNLRELRNAIERAVILSRSDRIGTEQLPSGASVRPTESGVGDRITLDELEQRHIRRILATTKTIDEAAQTLGIDAATLWRRRKKYGI